MFNNSRVFFSILIFILLAITPAIKGQDLGSLELTLSNYQKFSSLGEMTLKVLDQDNNLISSQILREEVVELQLPPGIYQVELLAYQRQCLGLKKSYFKLLARDYKKQVLVTKLNNHLKLTLK